VARGLGSQRNPALAGSPGTPSRPSVTRLLPRSSRPQGFHLTYGPGGGDFTKLNLAWLNWWLKGDLGATGKGLLVGAGCTYCKDSAWEVMSAKVP